MQFDNEIAIEFIIRELSPTDFTSWQGQLFKQKKIDSFSNFDSIIAFRTMFKLGENNLIKPRNPTCEIYYQSYIKSLPKFYFQVKNRSFFSKKMLFSRFRTDIEYNGTNWVHRNSELAQMEDFWCPGNPSVNNYVAMNKDGNLALYDKTFLLSPNFCVRRPKQIDWPKKFKHSSSFCDPWKLCWK